MNVSDGITGTIVAIVLIVLITLGSHLYTMASISEECKFFGAFSNGNTIYKCEKIEK